MAEYRALYRKYRPQRFTEVIGQTHVTDTLAQEVRTDQIAHAYLFAGPRGTGKTSTARILAKSLNCTDLRQDGEPCNVCSSCLGIIEGSSMDVIELDAASHNKVEDVREIRANVGTVASAGGARRVYILDEAHMLSRAASNALLKTLEEPPEHAHFVLATTEPYKLPDTIRSRTQRFDFHPIGSETLIAHIDGIAAAEGFEAGHESLALIARHAAGSARDAIGLLEQVAALGGGLVEPAGVGRALGLADADTFGRLVEAVAAQSAADGLALVSALAAEGADLRRFVADSIEFLRGVFLAQYASNLEEIVDEPGEVIEEWRTYSRTLPPGEVLRCIDRLGEALVELREGREERLVVELAVLQMTRPETAQDPAALASRIDRLEERVRLLHERNGLETPPGKARSPVAAAEMEVADPEPPASLEEEIAGEETGEQPQVPEAPAAEGSGGEITLEMVDEAWPGIMARVRDEAGMRRHALFREARPTGVEGQTLVLTVPDHLPFHLVQLREDDRLNSVVAAAASTLLQTSIALEYRGGEIAEQPAPQSADPVEVPEAAAAEVPSDTTGAAADQGVGVDPTDLIVDLLDGEVVDDD